MKHICNYKVFERKDIQVSELIDEIYDRTLLTLKDLVKKKEYLDKGDNFYFIIPDQIHPFILRFSTTLNAFAFGETPDNETPVIFIPSKMGGIFKKKVDFVYEFRRDPSSVKHELVHYIDWVKYGNASSINIQTDKDYYNHFKERNAFYLESANYVINILRKGNMAPLSSFNTFMKYISEKISDNGVNLIKKNMSDRNWKKFVSRCYILFTDLKKIFK